MIVVEMVAAVLIVVSVALPALGVVRRNAFLGIRTRATMRDDASWQRGHRAAFLPMCIAAAVALALGVVCIVLGRADDVGSTVLAAGVLVAGALWGAAAAGRAVRRGPDGD